MAVLLATGLSANAQTDKVHLGVIYPVSTHGTHAPLDTNNFSFHALAGVSAEERGLAFAGLSLVVKNNVKGVAFAGFSNHIGNAVDGVLFAGFVNTYAIGKGMQFAGFSNIAVADAEGAQFSGFLNTSANLNGTQLAGFGNVAKNVKGAQFSGFFNVAKEVKGSQFAGFSNVSTGIIKGHQLAGFANIAEEVDGSQIAGFINVAKKVRGIQLAGFINIADSSDCPIGIINLIKNGEKSIGISYDETQTTLLSFRSGGKKLYGIIGGGYNLKNDDAVVAFEAGFGAHFFSSRYFRINTELAGITLEDFKRGEYFKSSFRLLPSVRISKTIELYGGASLNFISTNTSEGKALVSNYFWENKNRWSTNFNAFHIGYSAGLNFNF